MLDAKGHISSMRSVVAVTTLGMQVADESWKAGTKGAGSAVVLIGTHLPNAGAMDNAKGGGLNEPS